ncbi:MAG: 2-oxoacid:acceptor oxidoreductase family protein [Coriobacteriales bacterium]|jgi:indolepyruvate ferredoxin oxidoreductase beta subunit|nr:2-oxoacid:acceptor oxidoreductase family protein [Coriobacteriales bacterium]
MSAPILNIVIAGVGGQGSVLASRLLATSALIAGAAVRSAETIGMAQRGGSVLGHVRIAWPTKGERSLNDSDGQLGPHSPLVPLACADLLIGFEPGETLRALPYLKYGGLVVSATTALTPPGAVLEHSDYDGSAQLSHLKTARHNSRIGNLQLIGRMDRMDAPDTDTPAYMPKVQNVVLLGAALRLLANTDIGAPLTLEIMRTSIERTVKAQFVDANLQALMMGYHGPYHEHDA